MRAAIEKPVLAEILEAVDGALRALWIVAYLVGFFCVAIVLMESLERNRTWIVEERQRREAMLPDWKQVLHFAAFNVPALAVMVLLLAPGVDRMMRRAVGPPSEPDDYVTMPLLVAFVITVVGGVSYIYKVKELATACADAEHELKVSKLLAPLRNTWGEDWKQHLGSLRGALKKSEADGYTFPDALKERDALEVAIARAENERYRGESDVVVIPRSIKDIDQFLPTMAKLVGKRISGLMVSPDGVYIHIEFSDNSCFIMPAATRFIEGDYYKNVLSGVAELRERDERLVPPLDELETVSFEQEGDAKRFNEEFKHLFIQLWTKATGTTDYVKAEWSRMNAMLFDLGIR